ncbi:bifunctional serine/threonine protein kinase/MFS transporter [Maribacter litoralis]|uniref:serine/threonine-protein kinase n=1 Tax=Maribacter litoralis TaxID=2059726 RepID=UPI003F5CED75
MKLNQYEWDPEKDKLGEGTFAEVFKAKDINANRFVALKIYKTSVKGNTSGSTEQSKYSLEQEFQNIEAVSHTNIITYHGLNYIKHTDAMGREGSYPVIIMEYANQGTLTQFLKTNPQKIISNKLIKDIIKGIGHLHEEGIIHRDLKPGNILVSKNKRGVYTAKITDFGISKDTLSSDADTTSHTELVGTPHYMAPEQIYQKRFGLEGSISSRTDLWALGVIIFKIFTGKLPFGNGVQDIELVHEAITKGEIDLTGVPQDYHKLLIHCFKKNAVDRVSSANEMLSFIGQEETIIPEIEKDNDLERTVVLPENDGLGEGTIGIYSINRDNKDENQESLFVTPTKIQKILLGIFGIVNLLWFGYYWLTEEKSPNVYLIYPLLIILFAIFYLKSNKKLESLKLSVYGLMMYCNIIFLMLVYSAFYQGILEGKIILSIVFILTFQVGLSIWLIFSQKNKIDKIRRDINLSSYLLATSILLYLVSYALYIYDDVIGASTFVLLTDSMAVLTLLPNVFFTTALLFFVFDVHKKIPLSLIGFFIASIVVASIWWLLLDYDNGYKISLISSYMQELKAGYYLWFLSIFIGFSVVVYDALKTTRLKNFYWPILGFILLILGVTFNAKWSTSKSVYDYNRGFENVNYSQFKQAFKNGKPLKVSSYKLKNFIKNILVKYDDENANTVKRMLKLFVNSNGLVTNIGDADLASAITKEDPELVKILLSPTGSTKLEDVDFVHDDKSLLQQARDLENQEIEKLLINAGAKLTDQEKLVLDLKEMKALRAKKYNYLEDFSNGSVKFLEESSKDATWSHQYSAYKLNIKNDKLSYYKTAPFDLDTKKPYTVSVKVTRGTKAGTAGVVFDSNNSDYHIAVVGDNSLIIYKNMSGKWIKIKEAAVTSNKSINIISVTKNGNYISCYLNNKLVISNELIDSTGGNYFGFINSNPNGSVTTYFDDFRITGTKK